MVSVFVPPAIGVPFPFSIAPTAVGRDDPIAIARGLRRLPQTGGLFTRNVTLSQRHVVYQRSRLRAGDAMGLRCATNSLGT